MLKRNKIICLLLVVVLMFSFTLSTYAVGFVKTDAIEEKINLFANSSTTFTIGESKRLKGISNNEAYAYTLYELQPYGYAIVKDSNNMIMEVSYDENAIAPIPMDNLDYFYIGPTTFAIKSGTQYVLTDTQRALSAEDISTVTSVESQIAQTLYSSVANQRSVTTRDAATAIVSNDVGAEYFSNLNDYGNNVDGTCTVIAACMLLGYYDNYIYDGYISSQYTTEGSSTSSPGTTEGFHQLLCDYVYEEDGEPGGIHIHDAAVGINSYLNDMLIPSTFQSYSQSSPSTTMSQIFELIDDEHPAIASMATAFDAPMNHSVVVFGYQYTVDVIDGQISGNLRDVLYRTNYGHHNSNNDVWVSASWFYRCGHIANCSTASDHYYVKKYTGQNSHMGAFHTYKYKKTCTSCGYITYETKRVRCDGNCADIMSNLNEFIS